METTSVSLKSPLRPIKMNNSFSELEQLTLTLNHFTSHLHFAALSRQWLAQLAPRQPDCSQRFTHSLSLTLKTTCWTLLPSVFTFTCKLHVVFVQTHLELIGLLYDHLQLSVFSQAGAAHLRHLLLLRTHQRLVLIGVTWEHTYTNYNSFYNSKYAFYIFLFPEMI